jgi:hypothetical protein
MPTERPPLVGQVIAIFCGKRDCAREAKKQQEITDPSSRQRGCHNTANLQLSKEKFKEKEKLVRALTAA